MIRNSSDEVIKWRVGLGRVGWGGVGWGLGGGVGDALPEVSGDRAHALLGGLRSDLNVNHVQVFAEVSANANANLEKRPI